MKRFSILLMALAMAVAPATAQTDDPGTDAGIVAPDSPVYGLEKAFDDVTVDLGIQNPADVVDERSAEAQLMAEAGKDNLVDDAVNNANKHVDRASNKSSEKLTNALNRLKEVENMLSEKRQTFEIGVQDGEVVLNGETEDVTVSELTVTEDGTIVPTEIGESGTITLDVPPKELATVVLNQTGEGTVTVSTEDGTQIAQTSGSSQTFEVSGTTESVVIEIHSEVTDSMVVDDNYGSYEEDVQGMEYTSDGMLKSTSENASYEISIPNGKQEVTVDHESTSINDETHHIFLDSEGNELGRYSISGETIYSFTLDEIGVSPEKVSRYRVVMESSGDTIESITFDRHKTPEVESATIEVNQIPTQAIQGLQNAQNRVEQAMQRTAEDLQNKSLDEIRNEVDQNLPHQNVTEVPDIEVPNDRAGGIL